MRAARLGRNEYLCASCKRVYPARAIAVDHIAPVVPFTGFPGWEAFIARLFCGPSGLQILCRDGCHKEKTQAERVERRKHKL